MHKIVYAPMGHYNSEAFKSRFLHTLYIKSACALKVWAAVFVSWRFEDENHSLTAAELPKDNGSKAVTHISDFDLAERIAKATRNSTDWAVGVWQELVSRSGNVVKFQHCNVSINNFNM